MLRSRTDKKTLEDALGLELHENVISPQMLNSDRLHYQRPLNQDIVKSIKKAIKDHPDSDEAHADMVVAIRPDGTHWLINGQHHCDAALRREIPLVEIYSFDSQGHERERVIYDRFEKWQETVR